MKTNFKISLALLGFALLVTFIVTQGSILKWEPIDDAYISFRYAKNLAEGNGLVYNIGERVEGYTNFLWTVLLAGIAKAGFDIPLAAKWMGVFFAIIATFLTWLLARTIAAERRWPIQLAWLGPVILVSYPGWSYWAFCGMEGPLLVCLVIGFLLVGCKGQSTFASILLAGLLGVMAAMTRWETVLLWPVVVLALLTESSKPFSKKLVQSILLSAILLTGFGIYFIYRFKYYGEIMPNTYYAKAEGPLSLRIVTGIIYTGELGVNWLIPITFLAWILRPMQRWTVILAASFAIYALYVLWTGGDHFPWLRFYLPILPITSIMAVAMIYRFTLLLSKSAAKVKIGFIITVTTLIAITSIACRLDMDAATDHSKWVDGWKITGLWAKDEFAAGTKIVTAPIGAIGYYSEHHIIDFLGLTDYEIAHNGQISPDEPIGHQKNYIEYILRCKAEIVLGNAWVFDYLPSQEEAIAQSCRKTLKKMFAMPKFQEMYKYYVAEVDGKYIPYWKITE